MYDVSTGGGCEWFLANVAPARKLGTVSGRGGALRRDPASDSAFAVGKLPPK